MSKLDEFSDSEVVLIQTAKRTMRILAKVMADRYPPGVMQDMDLTGVIPGEDGISKTTKDKFRQRISVLIDDRTELNGKDDEALQRAVREMLADNDPEKVVPEQEVLVRAARLKQELREAIGRLTLDLPSLDDKEKGLIVGQLGPHIFAALLDERNR